jgi:hypothetical protein
LRLGVNREDRGIDFYEKLLRPDGHKLWTFAKTNGYATRVDEEVEFTTAKSGNPVEPLDARCEASRVDGPRGETGWWKGEAAAARATERLFRYPGGGKKGSQVSLEDELELDDGGSGVRDNEGASQIGDGVGKGDREAEDRGSHSGKAIATEELECEGVESRSDEESVRDARKGIREDVKVGLYV